VRDAADHIAAFIQDRTFADYETDPMFRSAVERQLEIVGEALNQFSKEAPDIAARVPNLRAAVAMRNALIHGYRNIEREIVWRTVTRRLPELRAQVAALLDELGNTP
jgi:uncharacterized protein with HEPN domain